MTDQTKDPVKDYIAREMEIQAEQGKRFPPEFIGSLAEKYNDAITEWLKANHAPDVIINAIDNLVMLERAYENLKAGNIADWDARWLTESIVDILENLAKLGGDFDGFYREPVMWNANAIAEVSVKA